MSDFTFGIISKKTVAKTNIKELFSIFSSRSFIFLELLLKSSIFFKLIFVSVPLFLCCYLCELMISLSAIY